MGSLPYDVQIRHYRVGKSDFFLIFGLIDTGTPRSLREYATLRVYMALVPYLLDTMFQSHYDVTTVWRQNVRMTSQMIFNWFIRFCGPENHMLDTKSEAKL